MLRGVDLQMFQPGQVSEGPFFNNPQTVDIPHRTVGIKENYRGNQL